MHHPPLTLEPIRSILSFILVAVGTPTLLVLDTNPARADIIRVPADQPTIQAGINAATAGDEVLVAPFPEAVLAQWRAEVDPPVRPTRRRGGGRSRRRIAALRHDC